MIRKQQTQGLLEISTNYNTSTTRQSEKKILPYDHSKNLIISQKFRTNCRPPTFTRRRPPTTTKSIDENDEDFEVMTTPTSYLIPHQVFFHYMNAKKKERKPLTNNSATIDIRIIQINTSITTNYLSKQPQSLLLNAHASFPKGSAIS